jgi:hypothetical protein
MRRCLSFTALFAGLLFLAASNGKDHESRKPATLAEIIQSIDWDKLPRPEGADRVHGSVSLLSYTVPLTFAQAGEFYRKSLPPLGWAEDKEVLQGVDANQSLYAAFDKGDVRLVVTGYKTDPNAPLTVTLMNAGNVDARKLPQSADAKPRTSLRTAIIYTTAEKPDAVAQFSREKFKEQGWQETPVAGAKMLAKEGRTILRFIQNAMETTVVITVNKDGQTEVTLSPHVRNTFDPADVRAHCAPKDVTTPAKLKDALEVLDIRKLPRLPNSEKMDRDQILMVHSAGVAYQAPGSLAGTAKFYRKTLADLGWTEQLPAGDIDTLLALKFEKAGYLVSVGASQSQPGAKVEVSVTNHGNVDLRQLPYPPGAEIGTARDAFVNTTTTHNKEAATKFYQEELPKLGWKAVKAAKTGVMEFSQNDVDLHVEIGTDTEERTSIQLRAALRGVE